MIFYLNNYSSRILRHHLHKDSYAESFQDELPINVTKTTMAIKVQTRLGLQNKWGRRREGGINIKPVLVICWNNVLGRWSRGLLRKKRMICKTTTKITSRSARWILQKNQVCLYIKMCLSCIQTIRYRNCIIGHLGLMYQRGGCSSMIILVQCYINII